MSENTMRRYSNRMRLLSGLMAFVCTYSFGNGQALAEAVHRQVLQASRMRALEAEVAHERAVAEQRRKQAVALMRSRTGADPKKQAKLQAEKARIEAQHPHARLEALAGQLEAVSRQPEQANLKGLSTLLEGASRSPGGKASDPLQRKLTEARGQVKLAQKGGTSTWGKALSGALDPRRPEPQRAVAPKHELLPFPRLAPRKLPQHGALTPELREFYASIADQAWVQTPRGKLAALELSLGVEPDLTRPMLASNDLSGVLLDLTQGVLDPPGPDDLVATPEVFPSDPKVVALAAQLGHDPLQIFDYLHDRFESELYYGSKKGALGALAEGGGNDFDLASLLISLYRASGIPARYEYGTVDLSPEQVLDLTGFSSAEAAATALATIGVPTGVRFAADGRTVLAVTVERAWVRAWVPYGDGRGTDPSAKKLWVRLDPGLKRHQQPGPLAKAVASRGLYSFDYPAYLASVSSNSPLEVFQGNLLARAKQQNVCDTLDALLPRREIVAEDFKLLPVEHPGRNLSQLAVFSRVPDQYRFTVSVAQGGSAPYTGTLPELYGKALSVRYVGATQADQQAIAAAGGIADLAQPYLVALSAQLRIDGTVAAELGGQAMPGEPETLSVEVGVPGVGPVRMVHPVAAGGVYGLLVSPQTPSKAATQARLDALAQAVAQQAPQDEVDEAYAQAALALYASEAEAEVGRIYALQGYGRLKDLTEAVAGRTLSATYAFGLPVSLARGHYQLDVAHESLTPVGLDGDRAQIFALNKLAGFQGSYREHSIWEQLLHGPAVSTVKVLQAAGSQGVPVLTLTGAGQESQLAGYSEGTMDEIRDALGAGQAVTVPQHPISYSVYPDREVFAALDPLSGTGVFRLGALGLDGLMLNGGDSDGSGSDSSSELAPPPGSEVPYCGNCVERLSDGDRLDAFVDLSLPAVGIPLVFSRAHRSQSARDLPLGNKWMHSYGMFLDLSGAAPVYVDQNLREVAFTANGANAWTSPPGWHLALTLDGQGAYHLRHKDGLVYDFDAVGHLTAERDPNGNAVTVAYDGSGRVSTVSATGGASLTFSYDPAGYQKLLRVTDSAGRHVDYEHQVQGSPVGDLTAVTDVLGKVERYGYSPLHLMTSKTDKTGNTYAELYDRDGRWIGFVDPLGNAQSVAYDDLNHKAVVTDRNGHSTVYAWNAAGNPVSIIDPLGNETTLGWDAAMNKSFEQDALGDRTNYLAYDGSGNATLVQDAAGKTWQYSYDPSYSRLTSSQPPGLPASTSQYDAQGNLLHAYDALGHHTEYVYDPVTQLPTSIIQHGDGSTPDATTVLAYNADGTIHTLEDPESGTTTLDYDANGHLTSILDPNQHSRTMQVDARGQVQSMTDALSHTTSFEYDAQGNRKKVIDPDLHSTTYSYDALNRVVAVTDALGNTSRTEYDAEGNVTARIDARGYRTEYLYDEANRLIETRMADGSVQSLGYCASRSGSQVCDSVDPAGHLTHTEYDKLGRVSSVIDSQGHVMAQEYDDAGRNTLRTDALGRSTHYSYDNAGRLIQVSPPSPGWPINYVYDARGNRTEVRAQDGYGATQVTSFAYDRANRLQSETNPLNQTTSYDYDLAGNRTYKHDAMGRDIVYAYDDNRRLLSVSFPDGSKYVFDYDARGNRTLERHLGPGGTTVIHERTLAYDDLSRLQTTTDVTLGKTLGYSYDANGQRASLTVDGLTTSYGYDALGRLQQVTDPDGDLTLLRYDPDGKRSKLVLGNGVVGSYGYDAADRLTSIVYKGPAGNVLQSFGYTLDAVGNRLSKQFADGTAEQYGYDVLDRLTSVSYGTGKSESFTLDAVGNIKQHSATPPGSGSPDQDNRQVNSFNQLTRLEHSDQNGGPSYTSVFTYDANGNLTLEQRTGGGAGDTTYHYDQNNRLTSVDLPGGGSNSFEYDANGLRTKKVDSTGTTAYVLDGASVVEELDGSGARSKFHVNNPQRIDEQFALSSTQSGITTKLWPITDALGSMYAFVDRGLVTIRHSLYGIYGIEYFAEGTTAVPWSFEGREQDTSLHMTYFRSRYLSAETGVWNSADPSGMPEGINRYLFVRGRLANRSDPSGLRSLTAEERGDVLLAIERIGCVYGKEVKQKFLDKLNSRFFGIEAVGADDGNEIAATTTDGGLRVGVTNAFGTIYIRLFDDNLDATLIHEMYHAEKGFLRSMFEGTHELYYQSAGDSVVVRDVGYLARIAGVVGGMMSNTYDVELMSRVNDWEMRDTASEAGLNYYKSREAKMFVTGYECGETSVCHKALRTAIPDLGDSASR